MENESLGERIKRLREARHWTQSELADFMGVTAKSISNWESGRNHPRSRMGSLQELFGQALEDDGVELGDDVEIAIAKSDLDGWRKDEVRSVYRRNRDQQRSEVKDA